MRRTLRGSRLFRRKDFSSSARTSVHTALLGMIVVFGALGFACLGALRAPHALADAQLQIVVPAPSAGGTVAQGPVGTNVSVTAQIPDAAGDAYQIGWAPQSGSCAANFTAISASPVNSDSSGNLSVTFSWPSSANTVGGSFYVCAQDVTNAAAGYVQSAQVFQVAATAKPAINVSGQSNTGLKGIFAGGTMQVSGDQFFPAGTRLYVFLNDNQGFSSPDFQPDQALPTADGSNITSANDGGFSATVKVPNDANGSMFVHVVSADGQPQQGFPPALVATKQITIAQAPTPTPNPTPSLAVNPGGPNNQSDTNSAMPAIIGLGALSVILFIVGVILIATVASSPSPGGDRPGSGTRY